MDPVSEALSASLFLIAGVSNPSVFYKSARSIRELVTFVILSRLTTYGLDQEPSNLLVPRTLCPDDTQICDRRIRDPCLGAVEHVAPGGRILLGCRLHRGGVRTMVRLGQTLMVIVMCG